MNICCLSLAQVMKLTLILSQESLKSTCWIYFKQCQIFPRHNQPDTLWINCQKTWETGSRGTLKALVVRFIANHLSSITKHGDCFLDGGSYRISKLCVIFKTLSSLKLSCSFLCYWESWKILRTRAIFCRFLATPRCQILSICKRHR